MITKFEAVFERNSIRRDGVAVSEFRVPAIELPKVLQTVIIIGEHAKVVATVIEDKDIVFKARDAVFEKLDVYREGNSRVRFITQANNLVGLDKVNELAEKNLSVEIYKLE